MMEYPNSGALFPARDKRHPKAPDFSGDIVMEVSLLKQLIAESDGDGVKIKISGWNREGRSGQFISLKYNDFKPQPRDEAPQRAAPKIDLADDSDIPF